MRPTRSKIAAGATIASLAVLGGVAYAAGSSGPDTAATAAATPQAAATPEVRTEVVRRTIHRHVTERHDRRGPSGRDDGTAAAAPAAPSAPVATASAPAITDDRADHLEPRDDHGGHGEFEAGDDHGGSSGHDGGESGDDHGGSSGHGGGDD
jgi:hypothetical protein